MTSLPIWKPASQPSAASKQRFSFPQRECDLPFIPVQASISVRQDPRLPAGGLVIAFIYDFTREKTMPERPQTLRHCAILEWFFFYSAADQQVAAAAQTHREGSAAAQMPQGDAGTGLLSLAQQREVQGGGVLLGHKHQRFHAVGL